MNLFKRLTVLLGMLAVASGTIAPVSAQDAAPVPETHAAPGLDASIDPVMRALLIGLAARMLTEAARSTDPVGSLGESMERALSSALRSPASARLLEGLLGHALKDVPPELREPLALFAGSMLESARRGMLDNRRPRVPY